MTQFGEWSYYCIVYITVWIILHSKIELTTRTVVTTTKQWVSSGLDGGVEIELKLDYPGLKKRRIFSNVALYRSVWLTPCYLCVKQDVGEVRPRVAKTLPPGGHCGYGVWRAMNRLRSGVGRCGVDMVHSDFGGCERCECGALRTAS